MKTIDYDMEKLSLSAEVEGGAFRQAGNMFIRYPQGPHAPEERYVVL
jgi:hypothetical protein